MIIVKAPIRISFLGGGTDITDFYQLEGGRVLSTTIDKFVYVAIHKYFENRILLKYSSTELVDDLDQLKNDLFRECLRFMNIIKGIEITSIADLPSKTGLGSSGAFTVALLHALHAYKGEHVSAEQLAKEACHIEIDVLGRPIGKQDQYASAYGGLNIIEFNKDDTVIVTPLITKKENVRKLNDNLLLFYTGITRSASDILKGQKENTSKKLESLKKMKELSKKAMECIINGGDDFGELMHQGWLEKRTLTNKISSNEIDEYYHRAINAGAKGGKLLGAGGGGFLLFYCEKEKQHMVRKALEPLKEIFFKFEKQGSRIIHIE